ncbi:MAG: DNA polymerase III subunit gamma/tau, partial [Clostridiales bacterium]|nr:DNA polymerase III subunit gamma/tau [Clostridiales bacterium]
MAYTSLYRRFRPETFDEVIGQAHIVRTLINQLKNGSVGHAYLFTGTRGVGKTSVAKMFARAVNCLSPVNGSPCGKCEVCRQLISQTNFDIQEIDAASNNSVDQIRELIEKINFPPTVGRYKVYIIDEVHMLSRSAHNALLKTLEEPPSYAIFILATTEVHQIPPTILSRCLRFDFRL